jgi:hypothetical protein
MIVELITAALGFSTEAGLTPGENVVDADPATFNLVVPAISTAAKVTLGTASFTLRGRLLFPVQSLVTGSRRALTGLGG